MEIEKKEVARKRYIKLFKQIYSDIPEDKKKKEELIERLADVAVVLDECKEHLDEEGAVVQMSQGNYTIDRENPWSKIADAKQKTYLSIMNKLDEMRPNIKEASASKAGEKLIEFVAKGKE